MNPLDQLLVRARMWDVTIEHTSETPSSFLAFGMRGNAAVVLKMAKRESDEWYAGEVLRAFNADGTVRVYESEPGAVLLERLNPGEDLVELVRGGEDDEATRILAGVLRRISQHAPPANCPTVLDWGRGFDRYLERGDARVPEDLVIDAGEVYRRLANSQQRVMLLHGDLQHYNVLFDSNLGWVAIDPKGVVGELEYEVGAILRNPVEEPELFVSPSTIERRLAILVNALNLNYRRMLEWSFAQAVLSVIWHVEDGFDVAPDHCHLRLAQSIRALLT